MPALHRERDTTDYRDQAPRNSGDDREISLGTGTILAIFFALALVCAVFFGLGYTMGRKSAQPATVAANPDPSTSSSIFSGFKPAAGSPGSKPVPASKQPAATAPPPPSDPDATIVTTPVTSSDSEAIEPAPRAAASIRKELAQQAASSAMRESPRAAPAFQTAQPTAMPAINPNGTSIVQVAAVSHQEDADVLISALKKRGYAVFIRQEPQDHLLHVQVGPFASKKDAEAMRQRLLADGYNAIVK